MKKDIRIMHKYYKVFGYIARYLIKGKALILSKLDREIKYLIYKRNKDIKLYLYTSKSSRYALAYIIKSLRRIINYKQRIKNLEESL